MPGYKRKTWTKHWNVSGNRLNNTMINYYVTILERFRLEEDPEQDVGDHRPFLVRANDKNGAREKIHKFFCELCDRIEWEWYISIEEGTKERIHRTTRIITVSDLQKVLPEIE
jgi:hypothetical protein